MDENYIYIWYYTCLFYSSCSRLFFSIILFSEFKPMFSSWKCNVLYHYSQSLIDKIIYYYYRQLVRRKKRQPLFHAYGFLLRPRALFVVVKGPIPRKLSPTELQPGPENIINFKRKKNSSGRVKIQISISTIALIKENLKSKLTSC